MKSKFVAVIILCSLLASILPIAMHVSPAHAANEEVRVYIDPPIVNEVPDHVDSFFDIYVTIEKVTDFFGFDIRVSWDDSLLTLDSTVKDTYFDTMWGALGWQVALEESYGGGGGGGGGYKLVALSTSASFMKDPGSQVLFAMHFKIIKSCNFILETPFYFDLVKLSDNGWQPILHTTTNGLYHMDKTVPVLEFELVQPDSYPFEYCKTFNVKVYVTHICAQLKDYDLTILYEPELLKLTGVDWTGGVLGDTSDGASYTELTAGTVNLVDTGGIIWSGPSGLEGLLFTLTFHIEFDDSATHIWTTTGLNDLAAQIGFDGTVGKLSFVEGDIPISGITKPSPLAIPVHLVRGDVHIDGIVDVYDLHDEAYIYDKTDLDPEWTDSYAKYDLNKDNIIDIFDLVIIATNYGHNNP